MNKARGEGQMEGIAEMKNVSYDLWAGFGDGAGRRCFILLSVRKQPSAVGCGLSATFSRMMMTVVMMVSVYEDVSLSLSLFFFLIRSGPSAKIMG